MVDAVALAYSGRVAEARVAAVTQAASADDFIAGQGLEALAVLGQQYGIRTNSEIDALLIRHANDSSLSRRAFEAAAAVESRALEPEAIRRFEEGRVTWDVLRYSGELPSYALGRALANGWEQIPEKMRDEALLTSCAFPVANADEAHAFGRLAMDAAKSEDESIRVAAFVALRYWIPAEAASICARALTDESATIRKSAAELLAELEPLRLLELAEELGEGAREVQEVAKRVATFRRQRS